MTCVHAPNICWVARNFFSTPADPKPHISNKFLGLICAKYSGISLTLADRAPAFTYGVTDKSPEFLAKFPSGKVPALEIHGQGYHLNESNAIADYLSSNRLKGKFRSIGHR